MKEKQFFTPLEEENNQVRWQSKRVFSEAEIEVEVEKETLPPLSNEKPILSPRLNGVKKGLIFAALLFLCACVAQTVQWLIDSWQQNQWISLSFAIVVGMLLLLSTLSLVKEVVYLRQLKQRQQLQQQSQRVLWQSAEDFVAHSHQTMTEQEAEAFCLKLAATMKLDKQDPAFNQWQRHLVSGYNTQEIIKLFSQYVLQPKDKQAQALISQSAVEAALVIAVSPLAMVDMLFLAWRNIRLINQIAQIYQMELGYWSRLRLLKMVLINLAFAGATEVVQEISLDWLSQDMAAKLSARFAQGMGAGILTARLGLRAITFCRPLVFTAQEKPSLNHIQKTLFQALRNKIMQRLSRKPVSGDEV